MLISLNLKFILYIIVASHAILKFCLFDFVFAMLEIEERTLGYWVRVLSISYISAPRGSFRSRVIHVVSCLCG